MAYDAVLPSIFDQVYREPIGYQSHDLPTLKSLVTVATYKCISIWKNVVESAFRTERSHRLEASLLSYGQLLAASYSEVPLGFSIKSSRSQVWVPDPNIEDVESIGPAVIKGSYVADDTMNHTGVARQQGDSTEAARCKA